jgi:alanine racemase
VYRNTYIEVDLDRLSKNVKEIVNTFTGYKYYIGIVKGNAYGYGEYISKCITENGINYLAVSSLEEAINVRKYVNDIPLLCLEPISVEYIDDIIKYNVTICVSSYDYFNELKKVKLDKKVKFHLKLNTGMNRLGLSDKEIVNKIYKEASEIDNLYLEGIFTHLATSGVYDKLYKRQIDKFKELVSDIDLSKIDIVHVGRSCTLDFFPKLDFCNGVRIGIMMYGVGSTFPEYRSGLLGKLQHFKRDKFYKNNDLPVPYQKKKITPIQALSLKSEIIEIHDAKRGDYVGYGSTNMITNDGYIAVIPLGYSDGIIPHYNNLKVKINNREYPVVGSINMGMMTIMVDDKVKVHDIATIIDCEMDYKKLAQEFNISPYVLLTNLRREIPRVYTKNGKMVKVINYGE